MNNMIESIVFPNYGYLKIQLTDEQVAPVLHEVEKIQTDFVKASKANDYLVGQIQKEFLLHDCCDHLNTLLEDFVQVYENKFRFLSSIVWLSKQTPMCVSNAWVNFQAKHEFNPVHDHAGILSFVLWIKIPYTMQNEILNSPGKNSKSPLAGHFSFYYTDMLGDIRHYDIPADQSMENCMLVFPAKLNHSVHPFYSSDDYRISVSGNIVFKI